jgi:hypothetical protein
MLLILSLLLGNAAVLHAASTLKQFWKTATQGGRYRAPTQAELQRAEVLFLQTLTRQGTAPELQQAWATLGIELVQVHERQEAWWVLRERPERKIGRGFYVLRFAEVTAALIQAPHSGTDRYTGEIAFSLLCEGTAKAAAWRTVPRQQADLAHLEATYFQAFTRAFAQAFPSGTVMQLHGFEQEKREGRSAGDADIVLSNGTRTPSERLREIGQCWQHTLGVNGKRYPDDVKDLGATTNAQALLLHGMGHPGFLHIEMSARVRERLQQRKHERAIFLECLHGE